MGQPWGLHVNSLQHNTLESQDRVQQSYVADRPRAAQQTSYAAAQVRQAVDHVATTDQGCDRALMFDQIFEGSQADDLGFTDAVSELLDYPAALSDPMQGAHNSLVIGKPPRADTALCRPSTTAYEWMRSYLCMQGRPVKLLLGLICSDAVSAACASGGLLASLKCPLRCVLILLVCTFCCESSSVALLVCPFACSCQLQSLSVCLRIKITHAHMAGVTCSEFACAPDLRITALCLLSRPQLHARSLARQHAAASCLMPPLWSATAVLEKFSSQ